ncbi:MAG: histidine kinase [Nocardioides sp.]|uniref:sensor histidine kinase n=1 Tax=Nocardioides sp. TaxID=35761 RepID=UPI0039E3DA18
MGWPEVLFFSVLLSVLAWVVHGQVVAWRRLREVRRQAALLVGVDPERVAYAAVQAERERLSTEISVGLRAGLDVVRHESAAARQAIVDGGDPTAPLDGIHLESRRATSELRRQIGLLRPPEPPPADEEAADLAPTLRRGDLALAVVAGALAGAEATLYTSMELGAVDWTTVILTVAAAVPVLLARTSPAAAAVLIGIVHLLALSMGHMVSGGFWMLVTMGAVLWTLVQRTKGVDRLAAAGTFLVASMCVSTWVLNRDNAGATAVLLLVTVVAATVRRVTRGREHATVALVEEREERLAQAREAAGRLERLSLARELHDVVSHAVAVVAVQASAATVSWRQHPATALAALDALDASVGAAIEELSEVASAATPPEVADLGSLVARARAAGLRLQYDGPTVLTGSAGPVAHRVVQEALTNVLRHARGATVRVQVVQRSDLVEVEIEDDGPGPSPTAEPGFGLVGLRERVGLAGGSLSTGPGARGGHRLVVQLPHRTVARA